MLDKNTMHFFCKEAKKQTQEDLGDRVTEGALATGAGAYGISKANPYLTGRTKVYHGGDAGLRDLIQQEGLRTRAQRGVTEGITDAFTSKDVNEASKNLAFVTSKKKVAQTYAEQKLQARRLMKENPGMSLADALVAARGDAKANRRFAMAQMLPSWMLGKKRQSAVAEMNVPLWKLREQGRVVLNPEKVEMAQAMGGGRLGNYLAGGLLGERGGTYSIVDGVDRKYVRGAADYKGPDLKEIAEYAKKHKGRFGVGALGTLGGLGAITYGLSRFVPPKKKKKKSK